MGPQSSTLLSLLAGILLGAAGAMVIAWLFLRGRVESARTQVRTEAQVEIARLGERINSYNGLQSLLESAKREAADLRSEISGLQFRLAAAETTAQERVQQNDRVQEEFTQANESLQQSIKEAGELRARVAELNTALEGERAQGPQRAALLASEFESLAQRILTENSTRFTAQNQASLGQLLGPLATKLEEFKTKVEDSYDKEGRERIALATQVRQLMDLNQQLSQDAHDLTRALKGSGKTQGNWGEVILERVLESSGLRKGLEYELRETYTREDGRRAQPDVVIHLPEDKHIVVDSKVSLTAYTQYVRADSDPDREVATIHHLDSIKRHVKELSEKNYQTLYGLRSLDFVVMFVPVEPAFMLAIGHDTTLCENAWKRNVLMVSPSTFLFVVRTVAYLWRQEQSTRNVREIAMRGAEFYDKLVAFVEDLASVGNRLRQASESYDNARNKLAQGRGNLIRQAEMLRELGVKPTKTLPQDLVESALTEQPTTLPSFSPIVEGEIPAQERLPISVNASPDDDDVPF